METVRYTPGEAIRWLEIGAEDLRRNARKKRTSVIRREGERNLRRDVREAAEALMGMGKGAVADFLHSQSRALEYALYDDHFEVAGSGPLRSVRYDSVKSIRMKGDKAILALGQGSLTIKPHAYILSGRIKLPIGWSRNGLEVPYEVLLDELSGRCGLEIERAV